MGLLKSAVIVAAIALAGPVSAHAAQGHDRGWDDNRGRGHHHRWDRDDHRPRWRDHRYQDRHWDRAPRQHYNQYYYAPRAYGYAAPAPGLHIVVPNIYIPLR